MLSSFDNLSLPQYGLYCKQIISTKSAQYVLCHCSLEYSSWHFFCRQRSQKSCICFPALGSQHAAFRLFINMFPMLPASIFVRSFTGILSIHQSLINIPLGNTTIPSGKLHSILSGIPLLLIHRHMLRNGTSSQEARFSASISLRLLPSITRTHSPSGFSSL